MTVDFVRNKLATDRRRLERAILCIDSRQTDDERQSEQTKHLNGRGWTYADARSGSYMARWLRQGNHLDGRFLARAQRMMPKYAAQLIRAAEEKQVREAVTVSAVPQHALPSPSEL
jgi:hypothetical protein